MLILAGVSLNALVGDNGIITNAQNATLKNSCAFLEEFLQEQYVSCYENVSNTKIDTLIANDKDCLYVPETTRLHFILLNNQMYYLIDKTKLPKSIQDGIKGGDAGNKTYNDYVSFNDVYGVTTDLKVYYCSNGKDSWFGAVDEEKKDSASRIAIYDTSLSGLGDYLSTIDWVEHDKNGNVLADKLGTKVELLIDGADINNLSELYNFSSLEKLYIKNSKLASLTGISTAPKLNYVYFERSTVGEYADISKVFNLQSLYLALSDDEEVEKICEALENSDQKNITNFSISGMVEVGNTSSTLSEVTDLSSINSLSNSIKNSIVNLYLSYNKIENLNISGFSKCDRLEIAGNTLLKSCILGANKITVINAVCCRRLESLTVTSNFIKTINLEQASALKNISGFAQNMALQNLYLQYCYEIENLSDFGTLSVLENLRIDRTRKICTLSALKNCTTLRTLIADESNLGKGFDTNLDDGHYVGVGKLATNSLAYLTNKPMLKQLSLTDCPYILYTGYLADLYNSTQPKLTQLKTVYLEGTSARGTEISSLANLIKQCTDYTLPVGVGLLFFDSNSSSLTLKNEDIYLTEFNSIKTIGTNLTTISLVNINIIDDETDEEILSANYNSVVNNMLKEITDLRWVSIRMPEISEITFVKDCTGLYGLDLRKSNVGTSNTNGLKLLNTYCNDLFCLVCPYDGEITLDFTQIQPAISKMEARDANGNVRGKHKFDDGFQCYGLNCSNQSSVDSFANCTDITYFLADASSGSDGGNINMVYDLSGCTDLTYIYIDGGSSGKNTKYKLPDTSTYVDSDGESGYVVDGIRWHYLLIKSGGKGAKKISIDWWYGPDDEISFKNNLEGFKNSTVLKEIYINIPHWGGGDSQDKCGHDVLDIFKTCSNVESFTWKGSGNTQVTGSFTEISALKDMTKLKVIDIENTIINKIPDFSALTSLTDLTISNSKLDNIDGLKNCTSLLRVDLQKNTYIYDLTAIGTLTNLTTLKLSYNAIEDEKSSVANGEFNNINILNTLRQTYNHLVTLYIDNNMLSDAGKQSLDWATSI